VLSRRYGCPIAQRETSRTTARGPNGSKISKTLVPNDPAFFDNTGSQEETRRQVGQIWRDALAARKFT